MTILFADHLWKIQINFEILHFAKTTDFPVNKKLIFQLVYICCHTFFLICQKFYEPTDS